MPPIGIVIVTYNSEAVIGPCLDAALRSGAAVVVVDNASTDNTRAEIVSRGVRLLTNDSNLGFAKAVNQGFVLLNCPYVLLLNPDAVLTGSLEPLREACNLPGAAGAGGLLLDAKGRPQIGFMVRRLPTPAVLAMESLLLNRLWPRNPINAAYRSLKLDYAVQQRVEQPAGALLLIRREIWEELGGFDERFSPLWFEDVDFCRRAVDRGYCFYFVPSVVAIHTGAHSIPALTLEMRRVYWYRGLLGYVAKHFRPWGVRAVCLAVITGSFVRAVHEAAVERSLRPFATYSKVVRLASRLLIGECGKRGIS
jgi:GT2 family glycosyltransferase